MVYGAPPGHGGVQPAFDAGPPSTIQLTNPMARAGHARGGGYANDPRSQQILSALTGNTYTRSRDDVGSKASVHTTDGPGVTAVCKQARPSTIAYRGGTQAAGGHPRANPPFTHTHAFATRCQTGAYAVAPETKHNIRRCMLYASCPRVCITLPPERTVVPVPQHRVRQRSTDY